MIEKVSSILVSALFVVGLSGCAVFGTRMATPPGLQGHLENNVYTSPRGTFRIRIPWLSTKATLRDETPAPDTVRVTINDNLCREFIVSQHPGSLGAESLESWVNTHIVADLKRSNLDVHSESVMTQNGPAISLRYQAPAAAPCYRTAEVNGKKTLIQRDADVAGYVYHRDGLFYRLVYIVGLGPGAPHVWYINREPADAVLAQFARGFEILKSGTSR